MIYFQIIVFFVLLYLAVSRAFYPSFMLSSKKTIDFSFLLLAIISSVYVLIFSMNKDGDEPYKVIRNHEVIQKIDVFKSFTAKSDLSVASKSLELGIFALTFEDKKILFDKLRSILFSDQVLCERFFHGENLLTHDLLKKISYLSDSYQVLMLLSNAIADGYNNANDLTSHKYLGIDNLSIVRDGRPFSILSGLEKCKFSLELLSKTYELPANIENVIYDSITSYFIVQSEN
jgi:hypothetical protein